MKHHSLSKATRTHGIISIENYKKLPQSISQIVHNCKDHDMKVKGLPLNGLVQHTLIFRRHGYCSHLSNIRKYLVACIVVTGETYANI
jgi:hypothetical protein